MPFSKLLCAASVACAAVAVSAGVPRERVVLVEASSERPFVDRVRFRVDRAGVERLLSAGHVQAGDFPLPHGRHVDLELESFDVLAASTRFFVGRQGGVEPVAGPAMRFFRGRVAGESDSLVSLNLFGGRIAGLIRSEGKEYTFGPRSFSIDRDGSMEIEIEDDALAARTEGRCDGADGGPHRLSVSRPAALSQITGLQPIDSSTPLVARIALEGTVEWVAKLGGVAAAQLYTLNLIAQVSAVYESEVNVTLQVPYLLMNVAEPDGYTGDSNDTATELDELRAKWNGSATLRGVFRTAVHLFSTYTAGGGAGRAYIDVLCDNVPENTNSFDYGVSLLEGNGGSWERRLVAHELGHNFSSPHSHCFVPEIDECYNTEPGCYSGPVVQTTGTIMSYCSTRLTTFHQREKDEKIRPGAEAAYPACMEVVGGPGDLREEDGSGLQVAPANGCAAATLQNDDGGTNTSVGYAGSAQAAWIKRFTPSCYPFALRSVDVRFTNSSVAPGRGIRLLVYADPSAGSGPAGATLAYSQDTTVQVVGGGQWSHYTLSQPVVVMSGALYIGFYDLVPDTASTYIIDADTSRTGDGWWQSNTTDATTYQPASASYGTWMIRGAGDGVAPGSVVLSWGAPCNSASVPNQDFAVYQGAIGDWENLTSLTCTTGHATSWLIQNPPASSFWLVVPQTSASEGSYGQSSFGERAPAATACRPQTIGGCQ